LRSSRVRKLRVRIWVEGLLDSETVKIVLVRNVEFLHDVTKGLISGVGAPRSETVCEVLPLSCSVSSPSDSEVAEQRENVLGGCNHSDEIHAGWGVWLGCSKVL
jgi:hypothetical protein